MNNFIQNFIGFEGRLNRQRFWLSGIALAIVGIVVSAIILPIFGLGLMPDMASLQSGDPTRMAANMSEVTARSGWVSLVMFLIFLYPSAAICIKRRHDRNGSGRDVWIYFALTAIILVIQALGLGAGMVDIGGTSMPMPATWLLGLSTIVGLFGLYLFVVLGFLKGTVGANQFGPDPLGG